MFMIMSTCWVNSRTFGLHRSLLKLGGSHWCMLALESYPTGTAHSWISKVCTEGGGACCQTKALASPRLPEKHLKICCPVVIQLKMMVCSHRNSSCNFFIQLASNDIFFDAVCAHVCFRAQLEERTMSILWAKAHCPFENNAFLK